MDLLLSYFISIFTERKTETAPWINTMNQGVWNIVNKGIDFGRWVKHVLTASRKGDQKVQLKYLTNMALMAIFSGLGFLIWKLMSNKFFPEFQINYWNLVEGGIWNHFLQISMPAIIFAFLLGQLDWFGSGDQFEAGTIVAESLPFKWIISAGAGTFEELTHRGVYIYFGLIMIAIANFMFPWIAILIGLATIITLCVKFNLSGMITTVLAVITGAVLFFMKGIWMNNFVLWINKFIFDFYHWMTSGHIKTFLIIGGLMGGLLLLTIALTHEKKSGYSIGGVEFVVRVILFGAWASYVLPLGLDAIANMPIMPADANNYTSLLFLAAVMWSNAKFRNAHKYQGPAGMLNSYVIGFYMFYIAFNYGLIYAMIVHFLFDAVLFTSEHICQMIKNRNFVQ
ncbi:hypothetical protein A2331_04890 [Candidatus Falkowbacteria bacterium RIFOXYB2_FULL_34_18]|uniref:Uncharacterized protein n=1 Tax=Candidatus Falkowbacteria bacterium RIFOXYD2_FULL_34_120 TaxID=1798007 RepID=A0A1F5TND5_9BACT|nr:MAG: hypothetical protein A2331_04890 [Candidatus Falkowbacteria bacterium RIFOXYB2_FULL_34_18]OGF28844.1 MAG: hypothetical protein A2500_00485 [Candidatus Falkowbacteria bacterium RIFOXYC12_FULL_34_55]OGF35783.1 MAG: hypothetical protein A2466_04585 [Candidatus Falkowbacteria bacterium RIFOXYC2_FULL_34_220]OGF38449.1 MAG: hypothetical protein A2515_02025 [Candidatus Falkowbacteria bacterium RIFOXYD12_FULL_34_57]OGF40495.1 MAG: hypothetical protein A2531_02900 [Candidatus Falkowbacteria bact